MQRGKARCWLLRTVSVGSLYVALCSTPTFAQDAKRYSFDLPQQPLSESLKEYARVSGQQIIFTEDLVWGTQGRPLHGSFPAVEALTRLLQGTGLSAEHTTAGVLVRREHRAEIPKETPKAGTP